PFCRRCLVSYNPNDPRQSTYGNQPPPAGDPYAYYRPAPAPYKKPKTIPVPKVLIPFIYAAIIVFVIWCWIPPHSIIAFYLWHYGIPYYAFLSAVSMVSLIASCAWLKGKVV